MIRQTAPAATTMTPGADRERSGRPRASMGRASLTGEFFEFLKSIAASGTEGNTVRLAPVLIQPMAADDVAKAVASVALGTPVNGVVEVAGPEQFRLDEFIQHGLRARQDPRDVVADPGAHYFGATLGMRTLVPAGEAQLGEIRYQDWLAQPEPQHR